jgi:hypothetical protein
MYTLLVELSSSRRYVHRDISRKKALYHIKEYYRLYGKVDYLLIMPDGGTLRPVRNELGRCATHKLSSSPPQSSALFENRSQS